MTNGDERDATTDSPEHGMHGLDAVRYFLDRVAVPFEVVEHEQTFAASAEASVAGVDPRQQMAKTVILHDREGLRAAVIPASERLDLHKAQALIGAGTSHLRLASEDEIALGRSRALRPRTKRVHRLGPSRTPAAVRPRWASAL